MAVFHLAQPPEDLTVEAAADQCYSSAHSIIEATGPDLTIGDIGGNFLVSGSATNFNTEADAQIISANGSLGIGAVTGNFSIDVNLNGASGSLSVSVGISANSDLTIGHIGGNFSNQGGIFDQAGTLTIGAVDGTFVNAGVMGAARLELSNTLSHALENDGALTINGPGSSDIKVALNNAGGAITVAGGALSIDTGNNTVINSGTLTANGGEISIHSTVDDRGGFVQANSGGFVDFNVGISGGSASIEGGKLEYGWTSGTSIRPSTM